MFPKSVSYLIKCYYEIIITLQDTSYIIKYYDMKQNRSIQSSDNQLQSCTIIIKYNNKNITYANDIHNRLFKYFQFPDQLTFN